MHQAANSPSRLPGCMVAKVRARVRAGVRIRVKAGVSMAVKMSVGVWSEGESEDEVGSEGVTVRTRLGVRVGVGVRV